jgi:lipoprotein-releasing system permease protein
MIMTIFIVQGGIIGLIGTVIGVVSGIILALYATSAVNFLEHLFHVKFISSSIYIVDYLPSKLELFDVVRIGLTAFVLSLGATIYPAWRASRVNPAEALRYE